MIDTKGPIIVRGKQKSRYSRAAQLIDHKPFPESYVRSCPSTSHSSSRYGLLSTENRRTGLVQVLQAQRALRKREEAALLRKRRRGNRVYYSAERRHPVFHELKNLLLKTVALGDHLRKGLEGAKAKVCLAFVFGSVASGTEAATSDIDMLVVGNIRSRQLSAILERNYYESEKNQRQHLLDGVCRLGQPAF